MAVGKSKEAKETHESEGSPGESHLGDRDALALTARDAADVLVADLDAVRVRDAEDGHHDGRKLLGPLALAQAARRDAGLAGTAGESVPRSVKVQYRRRG